MCAPRSRAQRKVDRTIRVKLNLSLVREGGERSTGKGLGPNEPVRAPQPTACTAILSAEEQMMGEAERIRLKVQQPHCSVDNLLLVSSDQML